MTKDAARQHQWNRGALKTYLAYGDTCDVPQAGAVLAHNSKRNVVTSISLIEQNRSKAPNIIGWFMLPVVEAMQHILNRCRAKMSQHAPSQRGGWLQP